MIYHPRTPREAVNLRKEHADTAVYLAGGTDDLRLGGAAEGKDLIDITAFDFNTITERTARSISVRSALNSTSSTASLSRHLLGRPPASAPPLPSETVRRSAATSACAAPTAILPPR